MKKMFVGKMGIARSRFRRVTTTATTTPAAHKPKNTAKNHGLASKDLIAILREELEIVIDKQIQEEIVKQMGEKFRGSQIKADQRARIHKKMLDDARKQVWTA